MTIIESFINDLSEKDPDYNRIVLKYLCPMANEKDQLPLSILQLKDIHFKLLNNKTKIEKYLSIKTSDQDIVIEEKEKRNAFRISNHDGLITYILLGKGKIISMATMNKGGTRVLIKLCD